MVRPSGNAAAMKPAIHIHLSIDDDRWQAVAGAPALVRRRPGRRSSARPAGLRAAELSLVLASNSRVRALNRAWRKIDKPTNVLAFPAEDGVRGRRCRRAAAPARRRHPGLRDGRRRGGRPGQAGGRACQPPGRSRRAASARLRSRDRRRGDRHGSDRDRILAGLGLPDPYRADKMRGSPEMSDGLGVDPA